MTQRSLAKDKRDQAKLRHGRDTHVGRLPESFVGSYFPFFFTREGATISLNGIYRGASAFLVGGGPSFRDVPKERLRHAWVMTLNNGFASYRGQANCMVDDPSRFGLSMWLDPTIQKFVPMDHFEKPLWDNRLMPGIEGPAQQWERSPLKVGDCPNVVGYRRNEKFHAPRWLHEETINWGDHKIYGGGRSVMLAALRILYILGFRRVYLLGVDFEMSATQKYHFEEERTDSSVKGNNSTYAKLKARFEALQPYFQKHRFEVLNCHPDSKLKVFPFVSLDDAIGEACGKLGDFTKERTAGMYTDLIAKEATSSNTPPGSSSGDNSTASAASIDSAPRNDGKTTGQACSTD